MDKRIYVDHSATTFVKPEVLNEMMPYFTEKFGNASSVYSLGMEAKEAIEVARKKVAKAIGACSDEIYFTASGSEADNMILRGIARANKNNGNHIITSQIEHLAVLNTCKELEKEGFEITYLSVDQNGLIDINELENSIRCDTILVSIMCANNEIGTIQPIKDIGKITKRNGILFHTDAVQAIGNIHIDVEELNIDALALSAHKFYGPKGIGAAYIREGTEFDPVIIGGHQEHCKRAGTENVAGIVGLGKAIELATCDICEYNQRVSCLRDTLLSRILDNIPCVTVNGDMENRLPGNINISIEGVDAKNILLMLDMNMVCAASGSACNSSEAAPSHVLTAIGLSKELAMSSIRITLGYENEIQDIEYIAYILEKIVTQSRSKLDCNIEC